MLGCRDVRRSAQPAVDVARRLLAMADADGHRALGGHHVAAGEDPRAAGHHVQADLDDPVVDLEAGHAVEQREVRLLAEREHERVRLELLQLARRLRKAGLVEGHLLQHQLARVGVLDRREPLHRDALLERLLDLEVVRRHPVARAAVDDDRVGRAEPLRGARDVHRGVAAAVDDDAAAEQRLLLALHAAQHGDRVEDVRRLAGGDVGALADVGADREERRVEAALAQRRGDVRDLGVQLERHAQIEDPLDLGVEHVAREAVLGDAEAHHAAGQRAGLVDRDRVAEASEVVGSGQARGARADDEHALAGRRRGHVDRPAPLDRLVAEEPLDRVDPDRLVDLHAVARGLTGVVADAPHHSGQRVVLHQLPPGGLVVAPLGVVEPLLDVLAGGAGVVARRQPIDVHRALDAPRAGLVGEARTDVERDREGLLHHASPGPAGSSASRPKRSMLRSARACRRAITSVRGVGENRCA